MDTFDMVCLAFICAYIVMVHVMLLTVSRKLDKAKKALEQRPKEPNLAC